MKRIAIFGGAFDPMTFGHYNVAEYLSYIYDEVWIMPCYSHSFDKKMTEPTHRLEMAKLFLIGRNPNNNIFVSDYEIKNKLNGTTLELANSLKNSYNYNFFFVIGMDNANNIDKFFQYQQLIEEFRFIVVNRRGIIQNTKIWYGKNTHHHYLHCFDGFIECSSTDVRTIFSKNQLENPLFLQKIDILIDKNVKKYIINNKLYIYQKDKNYGTE